jgi:ATP-dependent 26S proteasome regulatory subunit
VDEAIGKPTETGISTRPGRIDRVFEMTNPDEKGRRKIASRILKDYPQLIEQIVADGNNDTGAQSKSVVEISLLKSIGE